MEESPAKKKIEDRPGLEPAKLYRGTRSGKAAEELGIRLAELHDFLVTLEGNAFMTQLSGMSAPQQIWDVS